jgi:hypothetical protein
MSAKLLFTSGFPKMGGPTNGDPRRLYSYSVRQSSRPQVTRCSFQFEAGTKIATMWFLAMCWKSCAR